MRLIVSFCFLLFLAACAKPADPNNSPYPLYGSVTTVVGGVETNCDSCSIFEVSGRALRVTFTTNGIDECSGEGTLSYLSNSNLDFPVNNGERLSWTGSIVGDNSSKSVFCFPDVLEFNIEKTDNNLFHIDYNGKSITVKKMN